MKECTPVQNVFDKLKCSPEFITGTCVIYCINKDNPFSDVGLFTHLCNDPLPDHCYIMSCVIMCVCGCYMTEIL